MFHVKHRPTYKELMMKRDAFKELRQRLDWALANDEVGPSLDVAFDKATGDVLITGVYDGVQRTHRVTITEETADVPRETSPHQKVVDFLDESDRIIAEQGLELPELTDEQWTAVAQDIARRADDVPRETSGDADAVE